VVVLQVLCFFAIFHFPSGLSCHTSPRTGECLHLTALHEKIANVFDGGQDPGTLLAFLVKPA
jgi:hypothetical protein